MEKMFCLFNAKTELWFQKINLREEDTFDITKGDKGSQDSNIKSF